MTVKTALEKSHGLSTKHSIVLSITNSVRLFSVSEQILVSPGEPWREKKLETHWIQNAVFKQQSHSAQEGAEAMGGSREWRRVPPHDVPRHLDLRHSLQVCWTELHDFVALVLVLGSFSPSPSFSCTHIWRMVREHVSNGTLVEMHTACPLALPTCLPVD